MDTGFRINCDLSDFFTDIRQKTRMYVNPSQEITVKHLCEKIRNSFNIGTDITIVVEGFFLSSSEDIRVLSGNDTVKVIASALNHHLELQIPVESSQQKHSKNPNKRNKKKRSKSNSVSEDGHQDSEDGHQKTINEHCLLETSMQSDAADESYTIQMNYTPPIAFHKESRYKKRKRMKEQKNEHDASENSYVIEQHSYNTVPKVLASNNDITLETTGELQPNINKEMIENENLLIANNHSNNNINETKPLDCNTESSRNIKKKRIRKRKRKDKNVKENSNDIALFKKQPMEYHKSVTFALTPTFIPGNVKHIRFSNDHHIYHDVYRKEYDTEPVDIEPAQADLELASGTSHDNYSENLANDQAFVKILALANANPVVVKREHTPMSVAERLISNKNTTLTESIISTESATPATNDMLTPFQGRPQVNDVLSFKILKLDQCYCPQLSGIIKAKVLEYCPDSQQMSFQVLDGFEHCEEPRGKFSNDYDPEDEQIEKSLVEIIYLNWQELIEPCHVI